MKTKCAAAAVRAVVTISVSTFFNFLETPHSFLAHAGCARRSRRLAYVLLSFLSSFLTIYLVIYWTDLRQICRVGRTVAADERSQVIFFDPSRDIAVATNFAGQIRAQSI